MPEVGEKVRVGDFEFMNFYRHWAMEAVQPGKPFEPMKAVTGYGEVSFYDPESFWEKWGRHNLPFYVEPKFDGIRLIGHVSGDKVNIFTVDKERDRADVLPGPVKSLKSIGHEVIIDGEMILLDETGKPRPRHEMAAIVSTKKRFPEDAKFHWYIYDLLYLDGKDLSGLPFEERRKHLEDLFEDIDDDILKLSPSYRIEDKKDFDEAFPKCANFITSEGAMTKRADAVYEVGTEAKTWAKIKLKFEIKVQVIGRYLRPNPWDEKPKQDLEGAEALAAFKKLQKNSRTWVLRCAFKGKGGKLVPIERHRRS